MRADWAELGPLWDMQSPLAKRDRKFSEDHSNVQAQMRTAKMIHKQNVITRQEAQYDHIAKSTARDSSWMTQPGQLRFSRRTGGLKERGIMVQIHAKLSFRTIARFIGHISDQYSEFSSSLGRRPGRMYVVKLAPHPWVASSGCEWERGSSIMTLSSPHTVYSPSIP